MVTSEITFLLNAVRIEEGVVVTRLDCSMSKKESEFLTTQCLSY